MDNSLPDPKPFNNPATSSPMNTNPYDTEIPTESVEHTPESAAPVQATTTPSSPSWQEPPSADQVRSNDTPHKPHHFATKKAIVLGALFIVTAALSSIITFALVGSRNNKVPATNQAPVARLTPTPEQMRDYANEALGLSFSYPATWTATETSEADSVSTKIVLQKDPNFVLTFLFGPAGVGGKCALDPAIEVGSEPVSAFGKPLNMFFEGDAATDTIKNGYVIASETPCPNIAFVDVADLTQVAPGTNGVALAQISFIDSTQPAKEALLQSSTYQEAKTIIQSLTLKSATSNISAPSNSDSMTACTMEAKVCPDGSSVGRVPPSCEFAACP